MASKLNEIEREIALLPVHERALLAKKILLGLDPDNTEGDDETDVERLWVEEAKRRSEDYKAGKIKGRPAS